MLSEIVVLRFGSSLFYLLVQTPFLHRLPLFHKFSIKKPIMRMLMFVRFLLYTLNPLCKGLKRDEKRKKESEEVVIAAVNVDQTAGERKIVSRLPHHPRSVISEDGCQSELYQRNHSQKQVWVVLLANQQLSPGACTKDVAAKPNAENRTCRSRFGFLFRKYLFAGIQTT